MRRRKEIELIYLIVQWKIQFRETSFDRMYNGESSVKQPGGKHQERKHGYQAIVHQGIDVFNFLHLALESRPWTFRSTLLNLQQFVFSYCKLSIT